MNFARGLGYMAGVLVKHQNEPLCGKCRGLTKTADKVRERMNKFEQSSDKGNLPVDIQELYSGAKEAMYGLHLSDEPVPQKKLGNCNLPDRGCFVKYSMAFFENIINETQPLK